MSQLGMLGILATSRISFWCVEVLMQPRVALVAAFIHRDSVRAERHFLCRLRRQDFRVARRAVVSAAHAVRAPDIFRFAFAELVAFVVSQFVCHIFIFGCRGCRCLTSRRSQPPLALAVPLSRFTSRVGGGSAFYVRRLGFL